MQPAASYCGRNPTCQTGDLGYNNVWSRGSAPPLQLWCIPAIIPTALRKTGAGNHHFKASFQLQSPALLCGFWKVKPYPASEETRGRHGEVTSAASRGPAPGSPSCLPWPRDSCSGTAAPSFPLLCCHAASRAGFTRSDHEGAALPWPQIGPLYRVGVLLSNAEKVVLLPGTHLAMAVVPWCHTWVQGAF